MSTLRMDEYRGNGTEMSAEMTVPTYPAPRRSPRKWIVEMWRTWRYSPERCAALRGAEWLDQTVVRWAWKVTRPVQVRRPDLCPLGQVFGSFGRGIEAAGRAGVYHDVDPFARSTWAMDHGFLVGMRSRAALDAAWETLVAARRRQPLDTSSDTGGVA